MDKTLFSVIRLQNIDSRIFELNKAFATIPARIEIIDSAVSEVEKRKHDSQNALEENTKARHKFELDIKALQEKESKFKSQLFQLKTNKEYEAMQDEIRNVSAGISALEEKIIMNMEEEDALIKSRDEATEEFEKRKTLGLNEKEDLQAEKNALDEDLVKAKKEREEALVGMDSAILSQYNRIMAHVQDGQAVVTIDGVICTGCQKTMPAHYAAVVRKNQQILTCDGCSRILYQVEDETDHDG